MTQLIPTNWTQRFARLREDIQQALDRWLPKRWRTGESDKTKWLPARWNPSAERLRQEVEDTFNRWLPGWWGQRWGDDDVALPSFLTEYGPVVDVEETDDEVVVLAEMPGLETDDFTVEVSGNRLILQGEKKHAAEERRGGMYYTERSYGAFMRVIPLPCEIDAEKVKAKYKNGVLRVTLPKTEQAKARRIKVKVR